jgi:hypothetical protein
MTLDQETLKRLEEHAQGSGKARSAIARDLVIRGLDRIDRQAKLEKLARDYTQDRDELQSLLSDFEAGQLELLHG